MTLILKNIVQKYDDKVLFNNFDLEIKDNTFTALMGESGCGKSTILRYLTGLQTPTSGEIIKPKMIPLVFQERSCLEYYSVLKNVMLPLLINNMDKHEAEEKAVAMLKIVGLEDQLKKYAKYPTLSGGQLQRVAIARSLVANPQILLMDEPFSSLDSNTRRKMQQFLKQLFSDSELTSLNPIFLIVTHDEREAVYLADNVLVMASNPGRIKEHVEIETKSDLEFYKAVSYLESII